MKVVLHACCAPCLAGVLPAFEGDAVSVFFYNPNIHPLIEFRKRLKAMDVLAERMGFEFEAVREYGLERFLTLVGPTGEGRCLTCYRERLERTAEHAARVGADGFSTTLLSSRHQDHEAIRRAGEAAGAKFGVKFVYKDLRDRADAGHELAKKMSLYRQQYCGCIFSEFDRYKDTDVEVYRGGDGR